MTDKCLTDKQITQRIAIAATWLAHYNALADGLRNMILGGRLTKADIPDDFEWLDKMLAWTPGKEEHDEN